MRVLKTLNRLHTSPYFLSLIPFLIICFTVPFNFKKYSLEIEKKTPIPENQYIWYDDLDNDGVSEKILASQQDITTAILITRNDVVIDQWNFKGSFEFWMKKCLFITGDANNDNNKEVYVFTLNNDTILLHCIQNLNDPDLSFKNRVVAVAGPGDKKADPFIIPAEMDDLDGDGTRELIFGIGSGFSKYPRNVFTYNILKDSLSESPESSYFISSIFQADINDDHKKEIIPYGYSASNVDSGSAVYHDNSTFAMILDQNLKFLFKPVEFKGRYTTLSPLILKRTDNTNTPVAWIHSGERMNSIIYKVNNSGIITDSVSFDFQIFATGNPFIFTPEKELLQVYITGGLGLINKDFKLVKKLPGLEPRTIVYKDFDSDGKDEILLLESSKMHIYRDGFMNEVSVDTDPVQFSTDLVTLVTSKGSAPLISVQAGLNHYLLNYGRNPAYPYYYIYYPLVYLGILAFALTMQNLQKIQIRKKYETEKRISELQLALIRNQLDPHFTFNVINSIIYSVEFRENEEAAEQLRQFAGLYRNMLLSAGSTRRTIAEELDFCENYLRLEKLRFKDKFDYNISVAEDVERNLLIPKFIIQIYVENAIKHGLSALEKDGDLTIDLRNVDGSLQIEITDNGIGREKSAGREKYSTGKGLVTMEELFTVYNRYYNEKVSSEITDLYDNKGKSAGTRITLSIRRQYEKV